MESVTVTRTIDAPVEAVEAEMADLESFMLSAGFDEVSVEGDRMTLVMGFTILRMKLVLDLVESDEHDVVYEQHEGPFEHMRTWYDVEPAGDDDVSGDDSDGASSGGGDDANSGDGDGGDASSGVRTVVSATTEFQLRAPAVGSLLDATVIKRQRRKELNAQFDHLEEQVGTD